MEEGERTEPMSALEEGERTQPMSALEEGERTEPMPDLDLELLSRALDEDQQGDVAENIF